MDILNPDVILRNSQCCMGPSLGLDVGCKVPKPTPAPSLYVTIFLKNQRISFNRFNLNDNQSWSWLDSSTLDPAIKARLYSRLDCSIDKAIICGHIHECMTNICVQELFVPWQELFVIRLVYLNIRRRRVWDPYMRWSSVLKLFSMEIISWA